MAKPDLVALYRDMARVRAFELAVGGLWTRGLISGEMHLGTGEEAVAAGVVAHLREGDGLALDHRPDPFLLLAGVDPEKILRELLGQEDGLCHGRGGHMHLLSREHLAASSGIVGASGPLAAGFALANKRLRPGAIAVATFGDGAINQGQLMESFNLAAAWSLPVVFVCKDNTWAIFTRSESVTGGGLRARAEGFGLPVEEVDGLDALAVHAAAGRAVDRARRGKGPTFLLAHCSRLDGHFMGDLLVELADHPIGGGGAADVLSKTVSGALSRGGGGVLARARSMAGMMSTMGAVRKDKKGTRRDPLVVARNALGRSRRAEADAVDARIEAELSELVARVAGEA